MCKSDKNNFMTVVIIEPYLLDVQFKTIESHHNILFSPN